MRKRSLAVLLTAVLLLLCAVPSFALVDRSDSFYVADYADVLSDALESRIIDLNGELEYYCSGSQLVVVSVDYLDGLYSDEYAMTLFNEWGVGSREQNNGTLLLLCPNENKAWLTYGAGLEGSLTSSRVDEMFNDVFWDPFDAGDYETAVDAMVSELTAFYASRYNVSAEMLDPSSYQDSGYDYGGGGYEPYAYDNYSYSSGTGVRSLVFLLIVILIIYLLIRRADRRRYQRYCGAMGYGVRPYHWWYLFWGPHLRWHDPSPPRPPMSGGYYSSWNHGSHQYGNHSSGSGFGSSFGSHSSGSSFGGHSSGGFSGGGFSSHSGGGFGGGGHGGGGGGRR